MTVQVFTPYLTVSLNGSGIDTGTLFKARVETSFNDPVSKGYVTCYPAPSWAQGDTVDITMGGGDNNVECFHGTVLEADYLNSGPTFELVCRGPLLAAQKYRTNHAITLHDLCGGPADDATIAKAVLDICGVAYSGGDIGGTGIVRGGSAPDGYTWRKGESGLEYLQRLSKASIGYKMAESTDQHVYRAQVLSGASGGGDASFTEGVDIFEGAHTQVTSFDTYEAWEVTGFDYGDGLHSVYNRYPDPTPDGVSLYAFSSEMIERGPNSDPRSGISCETVLSYIKGESDHPITKVSGLVTPRDVLLGPGSQVHIDSDMLGLSGNFWVLSVVREVDSDWFTQTLELIQ